MRVIRSSDKGDFISTDKGITYGQDKLNCGGRINLYDMSRKNKKLFFDKIILIIAIQC